MAGVDAVPLDNAAALALITTELRAFGYVQGAELSPDGAAVLVRMSRIDGFTMRVEVPTFVAELPPDQRRAFLASARGEAEARGGPPRIPHGCP